jgi:hypothetical protein
MTDTTMTMRNRTLSYAALLAAAVGIFAACLVFAPSAGAQNSGADQYLENVPNPSGDKPGSKDNKKGDDKNGGSGGSSGSGGSGGSSDSGGASGGGADDTEDALRGPGRQAAEDEAKARAHATPDDLTEGDKASAGVPSAASTNPPGGDSGGGGLSGGFIAFIAILLLGPVAFLLYRRIVAARGGIDTA